MLGLISIIAFEQKVSVFLDKKECCNSKNKMIENEIRIYGEANTVICIHKKMHSSLFIPNIEIFFEQSSLYGVEITHLNIKY